MFGGTQLGYAMGQMGWYWGCFWLTFSCLSTWLSGHLLGELCIVTGAGSYTELGRVILGRRGELAISVMQWTGFYSTGVVQIAYTGATWDQTFEGQAWSQDICAWQWMIITVAVLLPIMQVPSFSQFGRIALLASCATLYSTLVYLAQILGNGRYSAGRDELPGLVMPCYDKVRVT